MTKKEALANMYITLKKEFDGDEFNPNLNCRIKKLILIFIFGNFCL